jgi:hypothetical protein
VAGLFYTDQVALPLVVQRLGLRFKHLPLTYNHSVHLPVAKHHHSLHVDRGADFWRELTVLHYHRSMYGQGAGELVDMIRQTNPSAADWLKPLGGLPGRDGLWYSVSRKVRDRRRNRKLKSFVARCMEPTATPAAIDAEPMTAMA